MMSKLDQLAVLVPAMPAEIAQWLSKIDRAGDDTLAIILTCFCAGYSDVNDTKLLNELHSTLGANGIVHQMTLLGEMGFDQQIAYQRELKLSATAFFMLTNLAHCIGEFRQIRDYLKGIEL